MATFRFGPFSFETSPARLTRDGVEVRLRPRALETLRVLLQHSGGWVGYENMRMEAWQGVYVSQHTVDVNIAEIRKGLGEYRTWITHRPKFGYALEVPKSEALVKEGWHFWGPRTRDGCERAIECFNQALVESPSDFRAFEGLSASYLTLAIFGMRPPLEVYPQFLDAHEQAARLGGLRAELRCNRAYGLFVFERRYGEAEAEFFRALHTKPSLASTYVRLGILYGALRRFDDALDTIRRGYEVDPLLPTLAAAEVVIRVWQRDFEQAVVIGSKGVRLHPYLQVMRVNYAHALEFSGRTDEALGQYQIASVVSPDSPWLRALEAACQVKLGRYRDARSILEGLEGLRRSEYVDAYHMAALHAVLGQREEALTELERAFAESSAWLHTLRVDPKMDPLRFEPRFRRIEKAHRLPRRIPRRPPRARATSR